ncbi:hypothetical protein ACMD2_08981 [Ananas comosus]|uniref:Uncharacterized protein n=1 Tax=Ananas comosus TaxID=4615 RepID=A0A199V8Y8_ANACO|nr:hypothetical protein ACMD2_08981 [Ananas comosus]
MALALALLPLWALPVTCYAPEAHVLSPRGPAAEFRSDFVRVLRSRRRTPAVPLAVEPAKPVKHPLYQGNGPLGSREVRIRQRNMRSFTFSYHLLCWLKGASILPRVWRLGWDETCLKWREATLGRVTIETRRRCICTLLSELVTSF